MGYLDMSTHVTSPQKSTAFFAVCVDLLRFSLIRVCPTVIPGMSINSCHSKVSGAPWTVLAFTFSNITSHQLQNVFHVSVQCAKNYPVLLEDEHVYSDRTLVRLRFNRCTRAPSQEGCQTGFPGITMAKPL